MCIVKYGHTALNCDKIKSFNHESTWSQKLDAYLPNISISLFNFVLTAPLLCFLMTYQKSDILHLTSDIGYTIII